MAQAAADEMRLERAVRRLIAGVSPSLNPSLYLEGLLCRFSVKIERRPRDATRLPESLLAGGASPAVHDAYAVLERMGRIRSRERERKARESRTREREGGREEPVAATSTESAPVPPSRAFFVPVFSEELLYGTGTGTGTDTNAQSPPPITTPTLPSLPAFRPPPPNPLALVARV
ncbi:hypothetical protein KIPB_013488, partial [Kipferlia bialata]|eukprot:g13488.t1